MTKIPQRVTIRLDFTIRESLTRILLTKPHLKISRIVRSGIRMYLEKLSAEQLSDSHTSPSGAIGGMSAVDRRPTKEKKAIVGKPKTK